MNNETCENANQEIGKDMVLKEEDRHLVERFNENYNDLSDEEKRLSFRNVISYTGKCGFAMGGSNQYLINTDSNNRYQVSVRIRWNRGIHSGEEERLFTMNPGGKVYLGCTDAGDMPTTTYDRQVIGEVII